MRLAKPNKSTDHSAPACPAATLAKEQGLFVSFISRDFNDPIGLASISGSIDCNATSFGWGNADHSDMKDLTFYQISPWFEDVFKCKARIIK